MIGGYDTQKYYYLLQYSDTTCSTSPIAVTMMALDICYSQIVSTPAYSAEGLNAATTTQYAMATFTQGTGTSTTATGTLKLNSYSDSSCKNLVTGTTAVTATVSLPAAGASILNGPFGTMSTCINALPNSSPSVAVNIIGGTYSFNNKLEMEAIISSLSKGQGGPVYGTYADQFCTTERTDDPSGNQLPIYVHWSANNACSYSFLTQKNKKEACSLPGHGVPAAFQNSWSTYSDNQCSTTATETNSGTEADVRDSFPPSTYFHIIT